MQLTRLYYGQRLDGGHIWPYGVEGVNVSSLITQTSPSEYTAYPVVHVIQVWVTLPDYSRSFTQSAQPTLSFTLSKSCLNLSDYNRRVLQSSRPTQWFTLSKSG